MIRNTRAYFDVCARLMKWSRGSGDAGGDGRNKMCRRRNGKERNELISIMPEPESCITPLTRPTAGFRSFSINYAGGSATSANWTAPNAARRCKRENKKRKREETIPSRRASIVTQAEFLPRERERGRKSLCPRFSSRILPRIDADPNKLQSKVC